MSSGEVVPPIPEDECVIDTTRHHTIDEDAYWIECVRTDEHDCHTEPRKLATIPPRMECAHEWVDAHSSKQALALVNGTSYPGVPARICRNCKAEADDG